jgi:hypothetical protein
MAAVVIALIVGVFLIGAVLVTLRHVWRSLPAESESEDVDGSTSERLMTDDELARQLARVGSDLKFRRWTRIVVKVLAVFIAIDLLVSIGTVSALLAVRYVQIEGCRRSQSIVVAVRKVVDTATTPTAGPAGLTQVAGFDALDEHTQIYLRNLEAGRSSANPPGQPSLHDQLIAQLPDIDC